MRPLVRLASLAAALLGLTAAPGARADGNVEVTVSRSPDDDPRPQLDKARALLAAGKPDEALPFAMRAVTLLERDAGDHPSALANALMLAGAVHEARADHDKADSALRRAINLFTSASGPESLMVAVALRAHGIVRANRGDHERALPLLQSALAVAEKILPPGSASLADFLQPLADELFSAGDLGGAAPLLARALALRDSPANKEPLSLAAVLESMALVQARIGDDDKALSLLQRALTLRQQALGPDHLNVTSTMHSIAVLRGEHGAVDEAIALDKRVIEIREQRLGPLHPKLVEPLENLALLLLKKLDVEASCDAIERSNEIAEHNLRILLASGSEREKLAYLATTTSLVDQRVYRAARALSHHGRSVRAALTAVLRHKGRALDAQANSLELIRRRLPPDKRGAIDQLRAQLGELAALTLTSSGDAKPDLAAQKRLASQIEQSQRWIAMQSAYYREEATVVTVDRAQAALPANAALVELYAYEEPHARDMPGSVRYAAFVLRAKGAPTAVDLGAAAPIDGVIQKTREAFSHRDGKGHEALAADLDARIFGPLVAAIGDAEVVFVSPDRATNLIPFEALVSPSGEPRALRYSFTYLASGRDLLRFASRAPSRSGALILANPDFDDASGASGAPSAPAVSASPAGDRGVEVLRRASFPALPGTAAEASRIGSELPGAALRTGRLATKDALLEVHGPAILHIATHGFFLPANPAVLAPGILGTGSVQTFDNPLLRSGLAFAGANLRDEKSRSIMTALEVAGLDLEGTHLVTLSACETGLGDVQSGDGVHGLRRALAIAGAQTMVMSLWKVDDASTRDMMIAFYRRLRAGEGASEAMRRARLEIQRTPGGAHPFHWASFIVSGDPSPILPASSAPPAVPPSARGCACQLPGESSSPAPPLAGMGIGGLALFIYKSRKRARLSPAPAS